MEEGKSRKNLYDILEVSPRASEEVINAAYKALIKKYHPDKGGDERRAALINEAAEILLDPNKRREYDSDRFCLEGKIIGNYRVLELIAEGGFGKTYKGEHIYTGCSVCIKHASRVSSRDEEILLEEAKAIWDLRHFGIPSVRDILKLNDGSLAMVMSYIPGPTLEQIVNKRGPLEPEIVAWITERTLNILKYLHYNGVVHGDIKPQNIIIQPETHSVVLVDYGLSLIRPTEKTENKGFTPLYASPEQLEGKPLLPESDFYSLGLTVIFALGGDVGRKMFPKETPKKFCEFVQKFLVRDVLSRPNWYKEDIFNSFKQMRVDVFGREHTGKTKKI